MKGSIRRLARGLRQRSIRWIYPRAPWLHDALFFQLRRRLSRLHQALREGRAHRLPLTLLQPGQGSAAAIRPLVSVIVPCFNHAPYLEERLQSITGQSYDHWELILLDDASSDGSAGWLQAFAARHPEWPIQVVCNAENSGGPFRQWQRGLELARGELVWIAESDDNCESGFLDALVPLFADEAVQLAFGRTRFCSADGRATVWDLESYLPELGAGFWQKPWVASTHQLVQRIWSRRNLIPNVSAALFRRPVQLPLLNDPAWQAMRVCGDWIVYLWLARSGRVAYSPAAICHYRQHAANTSVALHHDTRFFAEHLSVCRHLHRLYRLEPEASEALRRELERRWQDMSPDPMPTSWRQQLEAALQPDPERLPEVMLGTYALVAGGGELAPLRLANLLKAQGYGVSLLNAAQHRTEPRIREQLRADIPLFTLEALTQLEPLVREQGIEILHSHHSWLDLTAAELLRDQPAVRLVVTSHGLYDAMEPQQLASTAADLVQRVAQFTVVAEKNRTALEAMGVPPARIHTLANAIDERPIQPPARAELGIPDQAFVACLVSRAIREKGWEVAIEAIQQARINTGAELHLLLVGSGPELQRLRGQHQEPWIHFLGFQPSGSDWFACADVGLLPSCFSSESRPFTLLECLRAGRPYIASDLGEIRSLLSTERGLAGAVIPLREGLADVAGFAAAISAYVQDPQRLEEHAARARQLAATSNSTAIAAAYGAVYRSALTTLQPASAQASLQTQRQPHFQK